MGTKTPGIVLEFMRIYFIFSLIFVVLNRVECGGIFSSGNTELDREDLTECTWCVKQMAKDLVRRVKETMKDGVDEVELRVKLTRNDLEKLDEFVSVEDTWVRVEDVLRLMSPAVYVFDELPVYINGLSPSVIIMMSTGGVTLCAMWMILSRHSIHLVTVLLLLLLVSVGVAWNWWKMYNEEYSKRVNQLPDECKPDKATWYHSVKEFLVDPNCGEYFKAPVDDPVAMVSPLKVITETINMIFVVPVSLAASAFTTFIHSLTDNLVWPLNWIVQIMLTVFLIAAATVLAITLLAGVFNLDMKFSTFFVSGELKPSKARPVSLRLPSKSSSAINQKRKRPTDLSLFPAPPSPFR